ncbi:hypothetical protein, partial [Candidatus Ichthyocystis sparus]
FRHYTDFIRALDGIQVLSCSYDRRSVPLKGIGLLDFFYRGYIHLGITPSVTGGPLGYIRYFLRAKRKMLGSSSKVSSSST